MMKLNLGRIIVKYAAGELSGKKSNVMGRKGGRWMRKIELMHKLFGRSKQGLLCKECSHFYRRKASDTLVRKCEVYGDSCSEATDWNASYIGCGLAPNVPYTGRPVKELVTPDRQKRQGAETEGQISLF